jgi:hypothetical protein
MILSWRLTSGPSASRRRRRGDVESDFYGLDESDGWTEDVPWVAGRLTAGDGLALADARLAAGAAAGRFEEGAAVG